MKSFRFAGAVFAAILFFCLGASYAQTQCCEILLEKASTLPDTSSAEAKYTFDEVQKLWAENSFWFHALNHKSYGENCDKAVYALQAALHSENKSDYTNAKSELIRCLNELKTACGLSADSFF